MSQIAGNDHIRARKPKKKHIAAKRRWYNHSGNCFSFTNTRGRKLKIAVYIIVPNLWGMCFFVRDIILGHWIWILTSILQLEKNVVKRQHWLEIRTKKFGAKVSPNSEKLGAKLLILITLSKQNLRILQLDVCERRRRERKFCGILLENRFLMPFVRKDWGHGGPHLQNFGGKSKNAGGHWPIGPRLFPSLSGYIIILANTDDKIGVKYKICLRWSLFKSMLL